MRTSIQKLALPAILFAASTSTAGAVTQQSAANVFNGRPYLYVEAESYSSLNDTDDNGFKVVSKESPITSPQGRSILPATSNVSGTALLNDIGGFTSNASLADTANYEVRFVTAGTYQLYTRHTLFDSAATPGNFGNEDSMYMSPGFNKNASTDWLNFQGLAYDQAAVGDPNPNDGIDPAGFVPATSDSHNNGWLALRDWGVKSAGVVTNDNNANNDFWNGNFYWYNRPFYEITNDSTGAFVEDFGFKTQFIVTPDMLNQTVTFQMGAREDYSAIDGFLFIKDDDLNLLDQYTQQQVDAVLTPVAANSADFNGDGKVDGADFLTLQRGFGSTGAAHADGDANNDGAVNAADLDIFKAQFGGGSPLQAVPEPAAICLAFAGCIAGIRLHRRKVAN